MPTVTVGVDGAVRVLFAPVLGVPAVQPVRYCQALVRDPAARPPGPPSQAWSVGTGMSWFAAHSRRSWPLARDQERASAYTSAVALMPGSLQPKRISVRDQNVSGPPVRLMAKSYDAICKVGLSLGNRHRLPDRGPTILRRPRWREILASGVRVNARREPNAWRRRQAALTRTPRAGQSVAEDDGLCRNRACVPPGHLDLRTCGRVARRAPGGSPGLSPALTAGQRRARRRLVG